MHPTFVTIMLSLLFGPNATAAPGGATVVVIRGTAKTQAGIALKEKMKVEPGTTVVTGPRSFLRLLFADNTQLSVGPDTTMKLEPRKAGEASLVDLVAGTIRAKVTKDPLAKQDKSPQDKMLIKTKTAAMGVRGTDFNVSFNEKNKNTALITFEGNVAMARIDPGEDPSSALRSGSGVQSVQAGQFSGAQPDLPVASIPVKISSAQLETLKANDSFSGMGEAAKKDPPGASPIPPGVDPKGFSSNAEKTLKDSVAKIVGENKLESALKEAKKDEPTAKNTPPPEGFFNKDTGEYAPRAGGFIDLASGRYVPPPAGSAFDPNTGTFVPPKAFGTIDPETGMYKPPQGVTLDPVKGFVAEATPSSAAEGTRQPSGGATATAPSPVTALVAALNTQSSPEASTKTVTLDNSFSGGSNILSTETKYSEPPPPPPPADALPPPPTYTDPVYDQPVSTNCGLPTCPSDVATTPAPTTTDVNFVITVQ